MELNEKQQAKLLRLARVADKGEVGLIEEIDALEDKIENLPKPEKGEKGDKGDQGERGTDGKDGKDGVDGKDGKDGVDGKDGNDGSPDTPVQVRDKLETLTGDERLDATAIKNLPEATEKIVTKAGWGAHPLMIQDDGTVVDKVARVINFTGGTVTRTPSGVVTVGLDSMAIGDTVGSATQGSVLFAGASGVLAQDNSNFFWDDSSNELGLGISSTDIIARLHIKTTTLTQRPLLIDLGQSALTVNIIDVRNNAVDSLFFVDGNGRETSTGHDVQDSSGNILHTLDSDSNVYFNQMEDATADVNILAGNLVLGGGATTSEFRIKEPSASGSNYTAFKAQAQAANLTYTLPPANVTNGFLKNDGSGGLTWEASSGWSITGNAGTTAGTNFLGTTDNIDMVFKRNSSEIFRLNSEGIVANNNTTLLGLGTTTPGARAHVIPENSASYGLIIQGKETTYPPNPITPNTISGLTIWLKADAIVGLNDDDPVTTWTASAGGNYTGSGSTRPLYKTNILNGLPAVRFDGTDDIMTNASSVAVGTVFVVANYSEGATFTGFDGLFSPSGVNYGVIGSGGSTNLLPGGVFESIWVNGTLTASFGTLSEHKIITEKVDNIAITTTTWQLGQDRGFAGRFWGGDVLEVIGYSSKLTTEQQQGVQQYLADKYGLTVANPATGQEVDLFRGLDDDGSTVVARITKNGDFIGNVASNDVYLGGLPTDRGFAGMWLAQDVPTASNYMLLGSTADTFFNYPSGGNMYFRIANGTIMQLDSSANVLINNPGTRVSIGSSTVTAMLHITSTSATEEGLIIKGAAAQSANLLELHNSSNAVLASIDETGILTLGLAGTQTATMLLKGTTSGTVTLKVADAAGTYSITLPSAVAANDASPLLMSTAGVLSYPTGTPDGTKFLRDDGAWVAPAGGGDVTKVGTPVDNQVGVWTGDGTIEGDADLTFDTTTNTLATVDLSLSNDLLLAEGSIINWDSGDATITQTGNVLAISGADLRVATAGVGTDADSVPTLSSTSTLTNKTLTSPTLTTPSAFTTGGTITLAENTSIALDPAGSADGKYTGITITGTAGATLAFGDLIYLDPTDSRWELADANAAAAADGDSRGVLGICVLAAASDGDPTTILLNGVVRADTAFPALTVNAPIYVSETAGDVTVTQPTTTDVVIRVIGFGLTGDEMYFNPDNIYFTHT